MNKNILIIVSLISTVAKAEMGWVTTPFFATPKLNKMELKLNAENLDNLKRQCLEFEKRLSYESAPIDPTIFDKYRKTDYLADDGVFKAIFFVSNSSVTNFLDTTEDRSKLPFYLQKTSVQQVHLDKVSNVSKKMTIDSYSQMAKNLNLIEANINFTKYKYQDAIEVKSKDLACDILNKRVMINANANSIVQITSEGKNSLLDLYVNKIQKSINETFSQEKNNSMIKAALLGFKLSKTFSENNSDDEVEQNIRNVFNLFFKGSMENSSLLSDTTVGKTVLISTSAEVPVEITLK